MFLELYQMANVNYKGGWDGEDLIRHLSSPDNTQDIVSGEQRVWILDRGFATQNEQVSLCNDLKGILLLGDLGVTSWSLK